jgi:hypothetical protein
MSSNVIPLRPTRRVVGIAHQVTFELVPRAVVEELFHAAIAVGWAADDDSYSSSDPEAADRLAILRKAVGAASQYTVPVEHEYEVPAR